MATDGEDRSHPNLQILDGLSLSYPGFERDKREAEAVHFGNSSLPLSFDAAVRRLKVKQRAQEEQKSMRVIHRSHPNLVSLDALKLTYPGFEEDVRKAEQAHNSNPTCDFMEVLKKIQVKQLRQDNDRTHYRLREIDNLNLSYPGWKADLRNLEKYHFEEAFFLPGDAVFQSKLGCLKRRQQIFLRSQKLRGTRLSLTLTADDMEDFPAVPSVKGSYAALLGTQNKPNHAPPDPHEDDPHASSASYSGDEQEERNDRQTTISSRTPYAVVIDSDVTDQSVRTLSDPRNERPDPPECEIKSDSDHSSTQSRLDCYDRSRESRGGVDCDPQLSVEGSNKQMLRETKSDPLGVCNDDEHYKPESDDIQIQQPHQQTSLPSRLSSYIDLAHIEDSEDSDGFTSEDADRVAELRSSGRSNNKGYKTRPPSCRRHATYRPKGMYSAPQLSLDEEETSTSSRQCSVATSSSTRAVYIGDRSTADDSQCSTRAVWTDERSAVSGSSSRAVWPASPASYIAETPARIRPLVSIPDTPPSQIHHSSSRNRRSSNGWCSEQSQGRSAIIEEKRRSEDSKDPARSRRRGGKSDVSRTSRMSTSSNSVRPKKLGRCTICGDRDKSHVFLTCGHLCACKACAEQVINRNMKCPVCRGSVTSAIQVFL